MDLIDESPKLLTGNKVDSALAVMFAELLRIDPNVALEKVLSIASDHQSDLIASVFEVWSISDLDAALSKANKLDGLEQTYA